MGPTRLAWPPVERRLKSGFGTRKKSPLYSDVGTLSSKQEADKKCKQLFQDFSTEEFVKFVSDFRAKRQ